MRTFTYAIVLIATIIIFPLAVVWIGMTALIGNAARIIDTLKH